MFLFLRFPCAVCAFFAAFFLFTFSRVSNPNRQYPEGWQYLIKTCKKNQKAYPSFHRQVPQIVKRAELSLQFNLLASCSCVFRTRCTFNQSQATHKGVQRLALWRQRCHTELTHNTCLGFVSIDNKHAAQSASEGIAQWQGQSWCLPDSGRGVVIKAFTLFKIDTSELVYIERWVQSTQTEVRPSWRHHNLVHVSDAIWCYSLSANQITQAGLYEYGAACLWSWRERSLIGNGRVFCLDPVLFHC